MYGPGVSAPERKPSPENGGEGEKIKCRNGTGYLGGTIARGISCGFSARADIAGRVRGFERSRPDPYRLLAPYRRRSPARRHRSRRPDRAHPRTRRARPHPHRAGR